MIQDTFEKFGHNFQLKLIAALILNRQFTIQISDILKFEYFDSEILRTISKSVVEYTQKYSASPTIEVLKQEIRKQKDSNTQKLMLNEVKKILLNLKDSDLEYVQTESLNFCRNQHFKAAIVKAIDFFKYEDYDSAREIISSAANVGISRELGLDYSEDFEQRYDATLRSCIPLPWDVITELTDGGLGKGELGILVGSAGGGKSWLLTAIGAYALLQGKNVVHYTLELNKEYVGLRYDAILTGIPFTKLKHNKEIVKEELNKLEPKLGKLIIEFYPMATISTFRAHVNMVKSTKLPPGKNVDLMIVDYGDLVDPVLKLHNGSDYNVGGQTYKELRSLAGELQIPLWTASQANRSGEEERYIHGSNIADSYKKIMVGDFILSVSRNMADKQAGTAMMYVVKNRFGPDGIPLPATANLSTGVFEMHKIDSIAGKKLNTQLHTDPKDNDRKLLASYIDEIVNEEKNFKNFRD